MASQAKESPPYIPKYQALGGTPSIIPDVPICAVFMVLYLVIGIRHQTLLLQSKKRGRKFGFCGMMGGLCWIRLVTLSLRIAWTVYPDNIRLAIAAEVFINVGTVLLYFVDLFFAQRIVRAQHPDFGWSKLFSPVVPVLCVVTVLTVIMVIVAAIQSFYTLSTNTLRIDRDIEIYVETAFAVIAFIPFVIVAISSAVRQIPSIRQRKTTDKFGAGRMRTKIAMLCTASLLLTFADSVKAGTDYLPATPLAAPTPWYFSLGVFYGLNLAPEIIVLYMYALLHCHLRFVIPDGAKGPHSYAGGFTFAGETGNEKAAVGTRDSTRNLFGSEVWPDESFGGTSRSSRKSVISWGGISRERLQPGIGEDGVETVPYPGIDAEEHLDIPLTFQGVEQELGYNSKKGQWELRPSSAIACGAPALLAINQEEV